jgi:hypothetical protein
LFVCLFGLFACLFVTKRKERKRKTWNEKEIYRQTARACPTAISTLLARRYLYIRGKGRGDEVSFMFVSKRKRAKRESK